MIGLGCMRLSTIPSRDDARSVAVIRAALDAGATLLDTADAYCLDDRETGHNERLIARALAGWAGDRTRITLATKGGMRRPKGAWVADGRARHLREACDASRRALGIDTIDLYQLHVVDPKTPLETSIRALARLQDEGRIRDIGLCNVTVSQIKAARSVASIASVQVSLSPLDDENLRNGVAEYCRDHGIRVIAYRPLGGDRIKQLARDSVLSRIASRHAASTEEIALAWLMSLGAGLVPIPGATRIETASSLARTLAIELDDEDRVALDERFSGRLLRVPRAARRPSDDAGGDVVIVMGMPGAGKTAVARALEAKGYERLNRDAVGGSLAELASRLDELLVAGRRRIVLDNTYPTRKSRNEVIETAWQRGVPARCIGLTTDVPNAQINTLVRHSSDGWILFIHAWRPQLARNETTLENVDACFARMRDLLDAPVDIACCPHDAGPPVCWCRKPIPGSVLELASRRGVSLERSIVVGSSAADRTMAERIGARLESSGDFFA